MVGLITLVGFALVIAVVSGGKSCGKGDWLALFTKDPTVDRISHLVVNSTFCNIQVKGCGSISIRFQSFRSTSFRPLTIFKIIIGGYGKKKRRKNGVAFYRSSYGGSKFPWAEAYGDFLSCSEFRNFWISWPNDDIKIGTGLEEETGELILHRKNDNIPAPFSYIRVDSLFGGKAEWRLNCHSSDTSHFLMDSIASPRDRITMNLQNEYDNAILDLDNVNRIMRLKNIHGQQLDYGFGKLFSSKKWRTVRVRWSASMVALDRRSFAQSWLNWLRASVQTSGPRVYNNKRLYIEHSDPNNLPAVRCPIGFWYHPDFQSCYKFVCGETFSHEQAKQQCAQTGGYLAIANSQNENNFFKCTLKADDESADFFLGGQRSQPNGGWVWTGHPSGSIQPFTHTDWNSGQPGNSGNSRCMAVSISGWNAVDCSDSYEFICEAIPKV